jgi:hypothetical protein
MSDVHAALSPDARTVACGDHDSPHRLLVNEAGTFVLAAEITPASSYPHHAMFHDTRPHVCLSAGQSSLGFDLGILKTKKKKALQISGLDGDGRVTLIDDRRCIYSGISRDDGYLLGDRDGYARHVTFEGQLIGSIHIGSTIEAMDVRADSARLLFGTCAGLLVEFDRFTQGREVRRWVFWRDLPPLYW